MHYTKAAREKRRDYPFTAARITGRAGSVSFTAASLPIKPSNACVIRSSVSAA